MNEIHDTQEMLDAIQKQNTKALRQIALMSTYVCLQPCIFPYKMGLHCLARAETAEADGYFEVASLDCLSNKNRVFRMSGLLHQPQAYLCK